MQVQVPGGQWSYKEKDPFECRQGRQCDGFRKRRMGNLFGNSMEITNFNGFLCESSNEDDIGVNYNNKER